MLEAMDETTKRKFLDGSSSSSSLSSSSFQRSSIGNAEEEEDFEDTHHTDHLELAENPVHKEDGTYMRHAVDEDDDGSLGHPHLTMNTNGMFFHPIVHTQSSYSTALENRNCKKTTSSSSTSGNGAWDHVPTSSLKQKQKEVFDRYALTGFRNKATTDAKVTEREVAELAPSSPPLPPPLPPAPPPATTESTMAWVSESKFSTFTSGS